MTSSYLFSFLTAGGALPIFNLLLAITTLIILYLDKKRNPDTNKHIPIRNLFLFFTTLCVVLAANSLIVAKQFTRPDSNYFCNMLISKSYLITTTLFVILMQEIDFISKNSKLFPILISSYMVTIIIADFFFVKVSLYWTSVVFGFIVVAINMSTYFIMIIKAIRKGRRSRFFSSKAKIVDTILTISLLMIVNYLYVFYLLSDDKIAVMYLMVALLTAFHITVAYRIIHGEPSFISQLDREEIPYPIIPALSEDFCDYGKNANMQSKLCMFFETEKPYLSPDLSISQVAESLFTNKSYLSKVLNINMEKNFKEFVNHYRVREAMKLFVNNNSLSINDLCRMCGFRNVASFTTAFRLHAGKTPGDWCRSIKSGGEDEKHKKIII